MIKKFDTYNESIRDKMTPKELSPNGKMVYKAMEELEQFGFREYGMSSKDGIFEIEVIDESDENNTIFVTIGYSDNHKWVAEVYYGRSKEMMEQEAESWEELLNMILTELYPDIDNTIRKIEKELKSKTQILKYLKKVKEIL